MSGDDRFEILLCPEMGDGVSTHAQKFIDSSPDGLELVEKPVPHLETAIQLLTEGHGDMVPVSAKWWYENRTKGLSSALVLPRREPTRVLVGENKPEYIPKNGIIIESHNDFLSRVHQHKLIIEGEKGRLEYDFAIKKINILLINKKPIIINTIKDDNDRFLREMKYFLKLISTKNQLDKNLKLDKGIHFLQLMKKTLQRL